MIVSPELVTYPRSVRFCILKAVWAIYTSLRRLEILRPVRVVKPMLTEQSLTASKEKDSFEGKLIEWSQDGPLL